MSERDLTPGDVRDIGRDAAAEVLAALAHASADSRAIAASLNNGAAAQLSQAVERLNALRGDTAYSQIVRDAADARYSELLQLMHSANLVAAIDDHELDGSVLPQPDANYVLTYSDGRVIATRTVSTRWAVIEAVATALLLVCAFVIGFATQTIAFSLMLLVMAWSTRRRLSTIIERREMRDALPLMVCDINTLRAWTPEHYLWKLGDSPAVLKDLASGNANEVAAWIAAARPVLNEWSDACVTDNETDVAMMSALTDELAALCPSVATPQRRAELREAFWASRGKD